MSGFLFLGALAGCDPAQPLIDHIDPQARAIYEAPKMPEGFYTEEILPSQWLYYVNTISTQIDDDEWFELCANDMASAALWNDMSFESTQPVLIGTSETERYYQFEHQEGLLARVHKCSFLDRSIIDLLAPGPIIGTLPSDPTEHHARVAMEYLWFVWNYDTSGHKILSATLEASTEDVIVVLEEARIVHGDFDTCDQLSVLELRHIVDRSSGEILLVETPLDTFTGICS